MESQKMNRSIFARQPAHVLLVDFSPPFDIDTCHNLHQTLENYFSLVCNLGGPCRTPLFGLYALSSFPECLFQLQHVRGNFPRLHNAFDELKNYLVSGSVSMTTKNYSCVVQGVQEAVAQFKRQSQTFRQVTGFTCQLEVTIITSHHAMVISKQIEKVTSSMDLENLKKIQVVSVCDPNNVSLAEDEFVECSQSSNNTSTSSENTICSVIDTMSIENDELSLQNFFNGWLHDCGTDREHLHLTLPSVSSCHDPSNRESVTLKCDLHERMINPGQLPFQAQYTLQTDAINGKPIMSSSVNKGGGPTVAIHRLKAVKLLRSDSICESVLYGVPLIVRPTACWKLDWEELDTNQQNFQALCQLLNEKELFMLAEMESSEETVKPRTFNYRPEPPKPNGHYLLLPSHSTTLLIKSIAVNELMLPCDFQMPTERPLSDAIEMLSESLNQLEVEESFNPLLVRSNLYRSLTSLLIKKTTPVKQYNKKTTNTSKVCKSAGQTGTGRGRGRGGTRLQTKSQYLPVIPTKPMIHIESTEPSQHKKYCPPPPPPPPPPSIHDIYTFDDCEDFPTKL